ncbi:uncharacterized mitochondrial protein AtMg00810-like [Gossypium hirsutum]|uniref:Uncharacterized mitochondrial protein AtMg00810-like n=1 Tax=Gossypium hirsutum TaxID=3635 RepID=A0A1U8KUJ3_GOSHI|nr:uncharacterized mitochondrial protein AtMg00810-like [Gossypium hirsutum]
MRSENEPTLHVKKEGKNDFNIVCLYVDDIIYTSSSNFLIDEFKSQMINGFEMSDMGLLHYFLGFKVHQAKNGIYISQRKYAKDLLSNFGTLNCKPTTTPMNINEKLQLEDGEEIVDARSNLQRFIIEQQNGSYSTLLELWSMAFDSDWESSLDDRRSVSANVFTLGSGVITWSSKKQATTALLTLEAEYVTTTAVACQAIWLRRMLADFQQEKKCATEIHDKESNIS